MCSIPADTPAKTEVLQVIFLHQVTTGAEDRRDRAEARLDYEQKLCRAVRR